MAAKASPKKANIPEALQLAGDEILRRRNISPEGWRENQLQIAKLAVLNGTDTGWAETVLLRAYAELFAEAYLAGEKEQMSVNREE